MIEKERALRVVILKRALPYACGKAYFDFSEHEGSFLQNDKD